MKILNILTFSLCFLGQLTNARAEQKTILNCVIQSCQSGSEEVCKANVGTILDIKDALTAPTLLRGTQPAILGKTATRDENVITTFKGTASRTLIVFSQTGFKQFDNVPSSKVDGVLLDQVPAGTVFTVQGRFSITCQNNFAP